MIGGTSVSKKNEIVFRKPLPSGVFEIKDVTAEGGVVELSDGSWMLAQGGSVTNSAAVPAHRRISKDAGKTWSDSQPLSAGISIDGLIRLQSGALAAYGKKLAPGASSLHWCFSKSTDEGKTWSEPVLISDYPSFVPMFHSMIQLASGRLLVVGYCHLSSWDFDETAGTMVSVHPDLQYEDVMAYGLWRGQKIGIEGHGHAPEMGMSIVYRSDDEGKTWKKHPGALMGWFDSEGVVNGNCGQTACFEPTFAETKDGNVLLLARSTVGRLVQSFSTDGGEHWRAVVPSDLPSSESPGLVVTLPKTQDLLVVWNQVSREEIRRGYRRGRLSSAISKDGGHSWKMFKVLELSEGIEDIARVEPEYPVQMVRARDWVGPLPDRWAYFHYANLDVVGDKIIVRYLRGTPLLGIAEQNLQIQESVMRVYPVEWFYA